MISTRLGKYEIKRWLGGGQFGDVYLAFDTILKSEFALKVSRMRDDEIVMLKDEARLLASLNHPNVVRFYNIDAIDGKFVLVMEYVAGTSLRGLIRQQGRLKLDRSSAIIQQVFAALDYAHRLGVIHRDLKPENILIAADDYVKLTDFGLARFIKPGSISASTAGTPVYMAPEAWAGKASSAADIWSATAVFYEMLTGRPPFLSGNLEELHTLIQIGDFVPPATLEPTLPGTVQALIDKGLSPVADERPGPDEFAARLSQGEGAIVIPHVDGRRTSPGPAAITPTPAQQEILNDLTGPIIVFGAPGSGKTETLTMGVIKKVNDGVNPGDIMVVTFTSKAAGDLKDRLKKTIRGEDGVDDVWVGTFHLQALKILRRWAPRLDYSEDFEVLAPDEIVSSRSVPGPGSHRTKAIMAAIGCFKANGLGPDAVEPKSRWDEECLAFYRNYRQACRRHNIMDFDDLILYTLELLEKHEDVRSYYAGKFKHIFVDELQDTNLAEYRLLRHFSSEHNNILFTGDEDQAIYGWRGARKDLMYKVYNDYPSMRAFVLNRSFRLPQRIVELAQSLILRNKDFKEHVIPISKTDSGRVVVYPAAHDNDEAAFVVKEISSLVKKRERSYGDCAILYRRNVQSRPFEEALADQRIPHTLIGGERFYTRSEVKMFVDYLTSVAEGDERLARESIGRILNLDAGQQERFAARADQSRPDERSRKVGTAVKCLDIFRAQVREKDLLHPVQILDAIITASGAARPDTVRSENIKELYRVAKPFAPGELSDLLEQVRLIENLDLADWSRDAVRLLTVHSAKGLEFPVVFLTGMIEGQFPMLRSLNDPRDLEEERRLCYVAITRARETLYLTYPKVHHGRFHNPSRFIVDMIG